MTEKNSNTVAIRLLAYTSKPEEVGKGYAVGGKDDLAKKSLPDAHDSLAAEATDDDVPVVPSSSASANGEPTTCTDSSLVLINEDAVEDDAPKCENSSSLVEGEPAQETSFGGADPVVINEDVHEDEDAPKCENSTSLVEGEPAWETSLGGADLEHGTPAPAAAKTVKEQNREPTSRTVEVQLETIAEDTTSPPHTPPRANGPMSNFETSHLLAFDSDTTGQEPSEHHTTRKESLLGKLSEEFQQSLFTSVNGVSVGAVASKDST